jgi:cytoskeletal protein CcmA (bactofilin family)
MSDSYSGDASLLNSIIGEGTRFRGEFDLSGLLRIDGDFSGTIRTKGKILIGQGGRAECNIYAETIVVGGLVRGNLFSTEKVVILSTGMMIGNICAPRLVVEEGVILNGNVRITGRSADTASPSGSAASSARRSGAAASDASSTRASAAGMQSGHLVPGGEALSKETVSQRN